MEEIWNSGMRGVLEDNILGYWLNLKDPCGGFYGEASADGGIMKDGPRGAILNARIIWAFSAAYRAFHKKEYLDAARWAKDWFIKYFLDKENGGVYWSVSSMGEPLEDKKQLYSQGFAIYGLSELALASGDQEALKQAINLFHVVESHFADREFGGYTEALSRDFSPLEDMSLSAHDINADKTMNSHLHIMEAFANLYRVWPDSSLKKAVETLLEIVCKKVMADSGHLQLYFKRDWTVLPGGVSYGHDIETSWLMLECAQAIEDDEIISYVQPYCLKLGLAGNEGLLNDGSMRYEKLPSGDFDDERQWWVQAETVVGNLWLWKYHGVASAQDIARQTWDYINEHLIDFQDGEWWWAVLADGSIDRIHPKAGFWKCPYHNSRMCLEALRIIE